MRIVKQIAFVLIPSTLISIAMLFVYEGQAASVGEQSEPSSDPLRDKVAEEVEQVANQQALPSLLPPVQLSAASSLSEIMDAMEAAHLRYDTLHVVVALDDGSNSGVEEVWLSQSQGRFRDVLTSPEGQEGPRQLISVSDGEFRTIYHGEINGYLVIPAHRVRDYPQPTESERQPGFAYSTWIDGELPRIGLLLAPKEFVNIDMKNEEAVVTVLGEEKLLGRNTLKMSVVLPAGGRNVWVDAATGIILKSERLTAEGLVAYTDTMTQLDLNVAVPDALFYVDHSAYDPNWIETVIPEDVRNP